MLNVEKKIAVFDLLVQITDEKNIFSGNGRTFLLRQMNGIATFRSGPSPRKWTGMGFLCFLAENMDATGRQLHLLGDDPPSLAEQAVKELFSQKTYC